MAGTINSLGIGSGVLTSDVIDKLKANDEALSITPITNKITLAEQKSSALDLLKSLLSTFKSSVSALDEDITFQKRSVNGTTDGVKVTADAGVSVQSFSISDTELAKQYVSQSGRFASKTSLVANGTGAMSLAIDGKTYSIDYTSSTTLEDLASAINNKAGDKIKASILQVGTDDYRMVLTSNATGTSQNITLSDSTGGSLDYALYQQKDIKGSGSFTATSSLVTSSSVTQSTKFSLSQPLTDGGISVEIGGVLYNADFDTDHTTTLTNFKNAIDASGLYTATINGNDVTISANTAGTPYTITTPFTTVDSTALASTTDMTPSVAGTYNITMNGTTYNIAYDGTTTLQQLSDNINTAVGSSVASIKQVGSSYQLILQSTATGNDATFSISDTGGFLDTKLTTGMIDYAPAEVIQQASDASFKYNGITITRSSNEIADLITGVTINLLQNGDSTNIDITQDVDVIGNEMSNMVSSYNTLMDQLNSMTLADVENGKVGIFNGDSTITGIRREITKLLTSLNSNGYSLSQFGIDLNETGTMSFNATTFANKFKEDAAESEKFFSGLITYDTNGNESSREDGIFTQLNSWLDRYTGYSGIMTMLTDASKEETKTLTANKTRSQALLDARYESMTSRFIEYDAIISKLNNQFSSLSQQISMAVNG
ncbi:flagellar filament capping protein FliD [Sulfuricurvum sp.]|uniref:flagellar filament capping protein FliD n=1 Tax=Sulfuricurvum sp. TaxID=2025608 RepID=UPI002615BF8B|nr:flagellar filament capping protein FliD [Sulfuricurvum sp.]MDD2780484.1 flagellar filament capping protein FliD [Sulfuricurvum sp.]